MAHLDLSNAVQLYYGPTEAQALYFGATLLWEKPPADIAFPADIFDTWGVCWDPYHPLNRQTASAVNDLTGAIADALGDPVGRLAYQGENTNLAGSSTTPALWTAATGQRPLLAEIAGRRCLGFDGSDDRLETTAALNYAAGGPIDLTLFGMIHAGPATGGVPWTWARGEVSGSYLEVARVDSSTDNFNISLRHNGSASFFSDAYGSTASAGWHLVWTEYTFDAFATNGGSIRVELDDTEVIYQTITPAKSGTASIENLNRIQAGARRSGGTSNNFFNGALGRFGFIARILDSSEKATVKQWLRGTSWVEP